ncbi:MAG: AbrB/MazE/SpoVT family DNA-binding domain-containing protein [Kouleothrix sp.]|jgi:AbrB family looped-hinge helix DNA binding protein
MQKGTTTLTRKGQLTVPATIRALFGLQQGDRVDFFAEGEQIILRRAESAVAKTAGIVPATRAVLSATQLREEVEDAIAEEAVRRSTA